VWRIKDLTVKVMVMEMKLDKLQKKEMVGKLQTYFLAERSEELGELAASLLVDFIVSDLSAPIYNRAVADAYALMSERLEELFELEKY